MASAMKVKGSSHYVWFLDEELGRGATGFVYLGKHRRKGVSCAIKVVNPDSKYKDEAAMDKELKIVEKLSSHENIVRFYGLETETYSKDLCLVMELCAGGSLYSILERPENYYGLEEEEFIQVLACLARGLYHLWTHGIVHRDVKPGNVLLSVASDGRHIYKLTDFGAATEDSGEGFLSLWGTEEYMDPSMYAHALNGKDKNRRFGPDVDLWSSAVTLYQCASGSLPYRPSVGVRKDRQKMVQLTSSRLSGVISRFEDPNGEIVESKELPLWCKLSRGLQLKVVGLLAGLQQRDSPRKWNIPKFWKESEAILGMTQVNVFNVQSGEHLRLYQEKTHSLKNVMEDAWRQTGIKIQDQILVYGGQRLDALISQEDPVTSFPETTRDFPIVLIPTAVATDAAYCARKIPELKIISDGSLVLDSQMSREMAGNISYMAWVAAESHVIQRLTLEALRFAQQDLLRRAQENQLQAVFEKNCLEQKVSPLYEVLNDKVYSAPQFSEAGNEETGLTRKARKMNSYVRDLRRKSATLQAACRHILQKITKTKLTIPREGLCDTRSCLGLLQKLATDSAVIFRQFKEDKKNNLPHNAMEIHKFHRSSLKKHHKKAIPAMTSCQERTRHALSAGTRLFIERQKIMEELESHKDWNKHFGNENRKLVLHQCQILPHYLKALTKANIRAGREAKERERSSGYHSDDDKSRGNGSREVYYGDSDNTGILTVSSSARWSDLDRGRYNTDLSSHSGYSDADGITSGSSSQTDLQSDGSRFGISSGSRLNSASKKPHEAGLETAVAMNTEPEQEAHQHWNGARNRVRRDLPRSRTKSRSRSRSRSGPQDRAVSDDRSCEMLSDVVSSDRDLSFDSGSGSGFAASLPLAPQQTYSNSSQSVGGTLEVHAPGKLANSNNVDAHGSESRALETQSPSHLQSPVPVSSDVDHSRGSEFGKGRKDDDSPTMCGARGLNNGWSPCQSSEKRSIIMQETETHKIAQASPRDFSSPYVVTPHGLDEVDGPFAFRRKADLTNSIQRKSVSQEYHIAAQFSELDVGMTNGEAPSGAVAVTKKPLIEKSPDLLQNVLFQTASSKISINDSGVGPESNTAHFHGQHDSFSSNPCNGSLPSTTAFESIPEWERCTGEDVTDEAGSTRTPWSSLPTRCAMSRNAEPWNPAASKAGKTKTTISTPGLEQQDKRFGDGTGPPSKTGRRLEQIQEIAKEFG